jgi:hypothetical protein
MLPSIKSKVVHGFVELSGLVLMGATFAVVIGCPYSDQIREAGSWLGVALVAGLTVYSVYQIATRFKTVFDALRSRVWRLAGIPGELMQAVNSGWPRIRPPATSQAHHLRLPPDIFFAKELGK